MTNMQAAIGVAQLEHIDEILLWRSELEQKYRKVLAEIPGLQLQKNNLANRKKIAWLISVLINENKRDMILSNLKENNIDARAFFIPLSEMEIYKEYARDCIRSKKISKMGLNLPTTFEIDDSKIEKIVSIINTVL
jgi:perosamine synthetase